MWKYSSILKLENPWVPSEVIFQDPDTDAFGVVKKKPYKSVSKYCFSKLFIA